jgi:hypothetical protein
MKKLSYKKVAQMLGILLVGFFLVSAQIIVFAQTTAESEFVQQIEDGAHILQFINGEGNPVIGASVAFDPMLSSPINQYSSAVLGIEGNLDPLDDLIIYIGNGSPNPEWTVNLNALDAVDGVWTSASGSYDYKDKLTVDLTSIFINPEPGCTANGFNSFVGGTFVNTSPITLVGTTMAADTICAWRVTDIDLEQIIPGGTLGGDYSLDMQLTMN